MQGTREQRTVKWKERGHIDETTKRMQLKLMRVDWRSGIWIHSVQDESLDFVRVRGVRGESVMLAWHRQLPVQSVSVVSMRIGRTAAGGAKVLPWTARRPLCDLGATGLIASGSIEM